MFCSRKRRRQKPVLPVSGSSAKKKSQAESRCLSWSNVLLGALIPVSVLIVTIVFTIQQQKLDDRRRKQDQDLANLTRMNDLEIANLTRIQDREFEDRRHYQDQSQADDLYYQDVFQAYIADISNVLFKQQNETFIDNRTKLAYIRSQTLPALRTLDWTRKTEIFQFLYENHLLPQISSSDNPTLDLSGSDLVNILLNSSSVRTFNFDRLSLTSVDLTNASFSGAVFNNGTDFTGSAMNDINLSASSFACSRDYHGGFLTVGVRHTSLDKASLKRADLSDSLFCDITCNQTDLAYADFTRAVFEGNISMIGTNLTHVNFNDTRIHSPFSMSIINADMSNAVLENSQLDEVIKDGRVKMINVILPNGTWSTDQKNIVLNGDAEMNCSDSSNTTSFTNWVPSHNDLLPTVRHKANSTTSFLGKCFFDFTPHNVTVSMNQEIDVYGYSFFVQSGEARYNLSAHVACTHGYLSVDVNFYNAALSEISFTKYKFYGEELDWIFIARSSDILPSTRSIKIKVLYGEGTCYADNIQLYITRKTTNI